MCSSKKSMLLKGMVFISFFISHISMASVSIEVVDVGSGLCVLGADEAEERYFVYDAGHWQNKLCFQHVASKVKQSSLDIVIISHPDSDHIGNLPEILGKYTPSYILHTGYERKRLVTWLKASKAIEKAVNLGAKGIDLSKVGSISSPMHFNVGNMVLEVLYGKPTWDGEPLGESEGRNAISIVVKVTAYGKSVLLAGDTVGRHEDTPSATSLYSELDMVSSLGDVLASDVLIAPHHGANNALSGPFLDSVSPSWIIFSSGHRYQHPRSKTISRVSEYVSLSYQNLLRTDRGDDEGSLEWDYLRIPGCKDSAGDDNIDIKINPSGSLTVQYQEAENRC
ncbi:MBL fold metallo-hydrolase [Vibrio parahaemolyticus]|uniref:ComEC/Rec2 family competence protein n=2 Tax=Vibrio parahaemolyticus TaxID=670 RepID=UPI0013761E9C|nr:MBL fold metallo-hydrolase [Vibrio parahaemolyticus]EHY8864915.1 MBL fold metallo-hydrolase [Vibrio parahaemolyticus]EII3128828.1 MBL fold metallo-hydrolase [Vibrio parahaemolyticus]EJB1773835.1 MBL fold metallo-hydrolase [Vibrio parahaemolyticus]EJG1506775.1 MBL fold metallo-hydrolase [Vibrio parahaemolyticus]MBM5145952.1 MBL fold metallo-hydrolase [Vibrio parahaemolyticus]